MRTRKRSRESDIGSRGARFQDPDREYGANVAQLRNLDPDRVLKRQFQRAEEQADFDAQHGPVRQLWQNGKPCTGGR